MSGKHWDRMTLRDRVLVKLSTSAKGQTKDFASYVRSCVPFALSNRAASVVGNAMMAAPELLLDNMPFARPPFETMWIEADVDSLIIHPGLDYRAKERGTDVTVGYQIKYYQERDIVAFLVASSDGSGDPHYSPTLTEVCLSGPHPAKAVYGSTLEGRADAAWHRATYKKLGSKALIMGDRVRYIPRKGFDLERTIVTRGEVATVIGLLLAINQPPAITTLSDVPRVRGIAKGKPVQYFGHTQVDIVLGQEPRVLRHEHIGTHASPRWHEVRGHWVHRGGERGCIHDWQQLDDHNHYVCSVCGRKRTWRVYADGRGDAGKGYIHQQRRIRTPQDENSRAQA